MASKSKQKGSSYERDVAKFLSELYSVPFMRNISGSGAFVGGTNSGRRSNMTEGQIRSARGDIVPPDTWNRFNCECKSYGDMSFHQLIGDKCAQLEAWLNQLMAVAVGGDVNILFFKITRRGQWVAVPNDAHWVRDCGYTVYRSESTGDWLIFSLDDFFKHNRDHLKNFCEQRPAQ